MIDLDAYLQRVGLAEPLEAGRESLERLHLAHLAAIPFENIDVRLRRPIGLDLESLEAKLVRRRRGGYCFEQNTLFAAALQALRFEVTTLEARVRPPGATHALPRTHMTLRVGVQGREYLADVGFGGSGPLLPVPLDGTVVEQFDGGYVVQREEGRVLVLRQRLRGEWRDLYAFTPTPALPIDFEVANHFTSTYPSSPFVNTLTVQRSGPEGRQILRDRTYTIRVGEEETVREVSDEEVAALLRDQFALDISEEEAYLALEGVEEVPGTPE
jgi:N-hydroxyarylamine O-acetyltransferase